MQLEKSLAINTHFQLQWEEKQNCFVLLYPEGMVQLSQSAGEIMNLCDGKNTIIDITNALEEKFNLVGLLTDVKEFLEDAMNRKWVIYND
ncbi:pyrroloquinoline quinone biosynthesis peptide chaperone PqqD [Poseidonibacter ostreae]|jgi:pyrroloquinoline quinone biosynthesis protein D|uniref:Pyrroloquinoline quinone biosynthesis peptide chaperone PqqD n=1 Tax=Poseidonibacter ostreae TaxID=2654171 RepID=A0A6L4WWD0_9BACT|nr:pyrroloquinoline quinone biosynthesis peptide chaperone PqqD [Poseidonibacter ostreae]KAB7885575.1 pyrroloquinoline quinone biosynthesis peptide chaperone PqqD [Poseidonibacter ostreae]KAB7891026.1 pyrroloquinoline quinone biosynthesis peptide chaperone PqqD [Poseidonibacter ostreae]KAB7892750.1 pyrroloquinoline quinone biosynthesis peptide chaperone PqqD [Poseidonibacter ostreae]MAC83867.1 pyrroloquinoline quinone biosynthesis peptide chaperone PqqD [Arcobacter sp.]|tara:strand:- start:3 stop:272 length:270 start_codon:yes stop_codon:yes gene_type:complete